MEAKYDPVTKELRIKVRLDGAVVRRGDDGTGTIYYDGIRQTLGYIQAGRLWRLDLVAIQLRAVPVPVDGNGDGEKLGDERSSYLFQL